MSFYRPEIDGLRAIAIIPVILFHAGFSIFSGGFLGVDVFFVISGYLISGIILKEIKGSKFSLLTFYERRARRILPNLLMVILTSLILSWKFLDLTSLEEYGKSLIGVASFSSNFVFWMKNGYFSESTELMPLIHTWSLSVEEQFYLFFPFLMLLVKKWSAKKIVFILSVLVILSLIISVVTVNILNNDKLSSSSFYLLPARFWEIGIGSIVAFIKPSLQLRKPKIFENPWVYEIFGISLILVPIFYFSNDIKFPGFASIPPVIGSALLILFSNEKTRIGKLLSFKPFVQIGLVSYSLYLWHQLIFSVYRNTHLGSELNIIETLSLILLTSVISILAYQYVEKPFRNKDFLTQKQVIISSIVSLIVIAGLGLFTISAGSDKEYLLAKQLTHQKYIYFKNIDERIFIKSRLTCENRSFDVLALGSSRLMQLNSDIINKSFINLSVSGASIEDLVAFVPEAVCKFSPKTVIIGVDPWLFNLNRGQKRWESVSDLYDYWKKNINVPSHSSCFLADKQSSYHLTFATGLFNYVHDKANSTPKNSQIEFLAKKSFDGALIYSRDYVFKPQAINLEKGFYSIEKYKFDSSALELFENLISFLKQRQMNVVFVLSPYHPLIYKNLKLKSEIRNIEKNILQFAKLKGIKVMGSYNPDKISSQIGTKDFYDEIHPKQRCFELMFN
jgi:peptidoglycan/LPS O-acetylase OafA/YrhL